MAQVLAGYDVTGSILEFDEDGNIANGGTKVQDCFFLNFSRLLNKDEIKKGSFNLELGVSAPFEQIRTSQDTFNERILITDFSGSDGYKVNSPAGEYGILYATASAFAGSTTMTSNGGCLWTGSAEVQAGQRLPVGLLY